jgi:hypothetical protein
MVSWAAMLTDCNQVRADDRPIQQLVESIDWYGLLAPRG